MLDKLCQAIAKMEGYYVPGSVSERCNNPGNLIYVGQPGAECYEVTGKDGKVRRYAKWATPEAGWAAQRNQILRTSGRHPGLTLATFFAGERDEHGDVIKGGFSGYAPGQDSNDPHSYAGFVASQLKVAPETPLSQILG